MYEFIPDIMKEAAKIMLSAHDIDRSINVKSGDANFVTEYDVKVQDFLYSKLGELLPNAVIIGEESNENHMDAFNNGISIIIDPIDGTTNFIHNYRHSAISVGITDHGKGVYGAVYNPYQDIVYFAERGCGAYSLRGSKVEKISVSNRALSDSLACFGTSPYYREELGEKTFTTAEWIFRHTRDIRRSGSAALDLAYVGAGAVDIFFEYRLSPWDFAAASVIIEEAGGVITRFDGKAVTLNEPSSILAGNPYTHAAVLESGILGK